MEVVCYFVAGGVAHRNPTTQKVHSFLNKVTQWCSYHEQVAHGKISTYGKNVICPTLAYNSLIHMRINPVIKS